MPHLSNFNLGLPIAKNGDSVIVWKDESFIEIVMQRVESRRDNEGEWHWVYFDHMREGDINIRLEDEILMNLTTGINYVLPELPLEELIDNEVELDSFHTEDEEDKWIDTNE